MNCKRVRELIITDYIDKELDEKTMKEVEAHIKICEGCGAFEKSLIQAAVEPFKGVRDINPPEYLWRRIKEGIERENAPKARWMFSIPRPVFGPAAIAVACAILIITLSVTLNSKNQLNNYIQDQGDFLSSLDPGSSGSLKNSQNGLGTTIEEFFS